MNVTLAFEGGGTRTRLGVYGPGDVLLRSAEGGPSNPFDLGIERCASMLIGMARDALLPGERPQLACMALAGALAGADAAAAAGARVCAALQLERALVTNDLYPILIANAGREDAVLAIAGTGSSVLAQSGSGLCELVGGRGVLFGDRGSAYAIAVAALRAAADACDGVGGATALLDALPGAAGVRSFPELVVWSRTARKADVARLCPVVMGLAVADATASSIVIGEAEAHADRALAGRCKVGARESCAVYCYGGVFDHSQHYFEAFRARLRAIGHRGPVRPAALVGTDAVLRIRNAAAAPAMVTEVRALDGTGQPVTPTEAVLGADRTLDELAARDLVLAMSAQDERAVEAVRRCVDAIAGLIDMVTRAIQSGGRVIYAGAGTSGRLGVLDASECPPTFGVSPETFIGIIAGGDRALRDSIEGAEDNRDEGRRDLEALTPPLSSRDVVIGLAASGTTPYTLGALDAGKAQGAATALICCNPRVTSGADVIVGLDTGAEVLAGSTRLKAGTATKLVLNMISTGAMALSGRVYRGLMVGVKPVNAKLWRRAVGIVETIAECSYEAAETVLRASEGEVPTAIVMACLDIPAADARQRLEDHGGNLRAVLDA